MAKYKKFIVSLLGSVLIGLSLFAGVDLPFAPESIYALVLSILTSVGVLEISNG